MRRELYQSARLLGDAEALASGDPRKIERRAKNRIIGRLFARSGFWKALWR